MYKDMPTSQPSASDASSALHQKSTGAQKPVGGFARRVRGGGSGTAQGFRTVRVKRAGQPAGGYVRVAGKKISQTFADVVALFRPLKEDPVDAGLTLINNRLGLHGERTKHNSDRVATIHVERTEARPRSVFFTPDMDGQVDSGEVVWVCTPGETAHCAPQERAILVIARTRTEVIGLLISPNPQHTTEDNWLEIGTGEWDEDGRECWIRMDRVIEVPETQIRRQGTLFPPRRFERIANQLRTEYHWA